MKSFALATFVGAAVAMRPIEFKFMQHLAKFAKSYAEVAEFNARLSFFEEAEALIEASNKAERNFTLGHNQFSDWSDIEYKAILGVSKGVQAEVKYFDESNTLYDEINWVTVGAVTPVKD